MERLTDRCWRNLDPWECCGQNFHCSRKLNDDGGCINGCIVPKLYKHLAEYEDLEEQGLLIKLPYKIGTTVYDIRWWDNITKKVKVGGETYYKTVCKHKVSKSKFSLHDYDDIGKEVFLTKEEAEKALERLEKENVKRD